MWDAQGVHATCGLLLKVKRRLGCQATSNDLEFKTLIEFSGRVRRVDNIDLSGHSPLAFRGKFLLQEVCFQAVFSSAPLLSLPLH